MAFNKEKFIAEAKAAGYSDDEINAELGGSTNSAKTESPIKVDMPNGVAGALEPPAMPKATPNPVAQPVQEKKAVATKQPAAETKQEQPLIPEWLQFPAAVGAGGAAVAGAVTGWKTLRDKMNNGTPAAGVERREPSMFGAQRLDEPAWSAATAQTSPLTQEEMMNRLRSLADQNSTVNEPAFGATATPAAAPAATPSRNLTLEEAQARMAGITPPAAPVAPPVASEARPIAPVAPNAAYQEAVDALAANEAKMAANETKIKQLTEAKQQVEELIRANNERLSPTTPARPVTPTPPAALASTVAPVAPPTGELKTGAGLPAYAGEGKQYQRMPKEFASVKEVPAGYAFVPGVGPGTNTIRNLETPEGYRAAVQLHGGPFGSHDEAVDFMNKYNTEQRIGPPADRTLRKSLGLPLQENTKAIPSMKVAKVGGVVGAIMAIPDLANAAQNRDVGQAATVASGFLPPAIQALIYSGGLNAGAEEENRFLRMRDYAAKAGRGVAQGYDPRRLIGVAPPVR